MNQEEELKKAREQYDAENQEIYDEVTKGNEELRRKKDDKPETYEQLPLFSRLNDAIEGKINQFGQFVADAAEDKEGISDDIVRGGLRGLQFVGNLPVIKQIGQLEEAAVGGVRNLAERQDLIDPRTFTYGTRIGLAFLGDKGIRTGIKGTKVLRRNIINAINDKPANLQSSLGKAQFGTVGARRRRKYTPEEMRSLERDGQLGLFDNEGDAFLYEKYKAQNKVIGTPLPKRQQAGRALRPTDFDDIIEEFPEITPDLVFSYIEATKAGRFGKGVRNPKTHRFKRNNRGLEGTLRFLNEKAAPNPEFDLSEIAAELSAEFNKTITPKTLTNIIEESGEGISFKTRGMSEPILIKDVDDLRTVYMGRLARYKNIPAFERGHVFAADNLIKDNKVANLTDFKNNLEPEIARSIYRQLDDEALQELIKNNVDRNFDSIEDTFESVLEGNRKRKNLDDPDKVIAELYGRDYGLRESFLNHVFPDRSLGRLIPADLKAAFTDIYQKELANVLLDYEGLSIGPAALDKIRANVAKEVLESFPDVDTRFVLEQMTLSSDRGYLRDMVNELTGEAK